MTIDDLFDMRSVVGAKLEKVLFERKYTKSSFCEGAGISRPTLDKLLKGQVTNKANYNKHIAKILEYLSISPDTFIGNANLCYNQTYKLRDYLNMNLQELSSRCGISEKRLSEIEQGSSASTAELMDLAFCIGTSVSGILGIEYFQTQLSYLDALLFDKSDDQLLYAGGFWGHIGLLLKGNTIFKWFPITDFNRKRLLNSLNQSFAVLPCMDNSLLLINCQNINEIVALSDDCDEPDNADWNPHVSNGEIPLVVYEAYDAYSIYKDSSAPIDPDDISESLFMAIDHLISTKVLDEDSLYTSVHEMHVLFSNGAEVKSNIYDFEDCTLIDAIMSIYEFGSLSNDEKIVSYIDSNGAQIVINLDNISCIRLPLVQAESAICSIQDDVFSDANQK